MMASFSAFANNGIHTPPRFITRIENSDGQVIYQNDQNYHVAIDSATNRRVVTLMNEVTRSGTARSLNSSSYNIPSKVMLAGKTGTTQNNTDGWFIGYTPDLLAGVWVGGNERHVRFRSNYYGQGARMALPVWGYLWKAYTMIKTSGTPMPKQEKKSSPRHCDIMSALTRLQRIQVFSPVK